LLVTGFLRRKVRHPLRIILSQKQKRKVNKNNRKGIISYYLFYYRFYIPIGQMGEGAAPLSFIWYAPLVIFFDAPIILIVTMGKEKKKR